MEKIKTKLSAFDNSWYTPGSIWKRSLWHICHILFINNSLLPFSFLKVFILKLFGAKMGQKIVIKPSVNIKYPWNLAVGNDVWIGENVWIDNLAKVYIGNNVCISQGAMLLTGNHNYKKSTFDLIIGKITLEDGVWIGARSVVCPGVICKTHSVLSVGSVATKDLEPYSINQGNPAVNIKERVLKS